MGGLELGLVLSRTAEQMRYEVISAHPDRPVDLGRGDVAAMLIERLRPTHRVDVAGVHQRAIHVEEHHRYMGGSHSWGLPARATTHTCMAERERGSLPWGAASLAVIGERPAG